MTKKITLVEAKELPETRDGSDYLYRFSLIDASLIGKPEEYFYTTYHEIKVGISGTMEAAWIARQENINFLKVCYEFGKRELVQKVKDGSIQKYQELEITSVTQPDGCPYQSDRIEFSIGATVNFDIGKKMMEDKSLIQIATSIIDYRDFINAIIKERHKEKLIIFSEERDILQLFRNANSTEEFVFRISALKTLVTNLNEPLLRKITGINDGKVKSISLLEIFLKGFKKFEEEPIATLKSINRLRQLYPIHGDNIGGVQEAHRKLNIEYPILNPSEAWKKVLMHYQDSLKGILEIIRYER